MQILCMMMMIRKNGDDEDDEEEEDGADGNGDADYDNMTSVKAVMMKLRMVKI